MIVIDRMELADIGSPTVLANAIVKQLGEPLTLPVPIEEIAAAVDITEIVEFDNEAFEGALVTDSDKMRGAILCRRGAGDERKRFTIGHELGHYLNPWHVPSGRGFECTKKDMQSELSADVKGRPKWEAEANAFAVEILMPKRDFGLRLKKIRNLELEAIIKLADEFEVSKIACARRVLSFEQETCAFLVSREGRLAQVFRSRDFPFISLKAGMEINRKSLTRGYSGETGSCSPMDSTEACFWTDRKLRGVDMFEQVLVQRDGWRLTLLVAEANDDQDNDGSSFNPRFAYR